MPLLSAEPIAYPEGLFDSPHDATGEACWMAFATRPRAEKSLARRLRERGLSYFLPLHRRRWKHRGRAFNSHLPLFPGYLFLFGDANARQSAWQTNLVIQVLTVPDQQRIHEDLARVHRLLASGEPVTPEDRLRPGTKVVISRGSFVGLEGTILRRDAQLRFVVEVQLLQRGVSLEVEEWMFETLGRVIADQPHDTSSHAHCSANGSTSAGPRPGLAGGFGGLS